MRFASKTPLTSYLGDNMKFESFTKEAICELLEYLADNETFASVKGLEEFKVDDVKNLLKKIASEIDDQVVEEVQAAQKPQYSQYNLSPKALSLISCLSPREEMLLFKSFHLL